MTLSCVVIQSNWNSARLLLVHHAHNKCGGRCHTTSQHNAILVHGRCETPVCRIAHGHVRHAGPSKHAWSSLVKRCAGRHMQTKQELIAQQPCFVHCILILNTQRAKPVRDLTCYRVKQVLHNLSAHANMCFTCDMEFSRHHAVE